MIEWKKYVDQIYCIKLSNKNNDRLNKELKRVGILDSGIYYDIEFIQTPIDNMLFDLFTNLDEDVYNLHMMSNLLSNYYFMKHAVDHNYNKILIIEDDAVFLKNEEQIISILENVNDLNDDNMIFLGNALYLKDYDCYHNGWTSNVVFRYCKRQFNDNIIKFTGYNDTILGCAAFNIYTKNTLSYFIDLVESKHFHSIDIYMEILKNSNNNIYFSETNICIQYDYIYSKQMLIDWMYLYNIDINDDYIKNLDIDLMKHIFSNDYKWQVESDFVLRDLTIKYFNDLFNQMNYLVFNNKYKDIQDFLI